MTIEEIKIEAMSYGPDAIGHRANGQVIFVSGGAVGDVARVKIQEEKHQFARGVIETLITPSPYRIAPNRRSGALTPSENDGDQQRCLQVLAPWAHLNYEAQLQAKRQNVIDALVKNAGYKWEDAVELVENCRPSPQPKHYRNKIEMAVEIASASTNPSAINDGKPHKSQKSGLQVGVRDPLDGALLPLKHYPLAQQNLADVPAALQGALRYLCGTTDWGIYRASLRSSERTGDFEVALWTTPDSLPRKALATTLSSALPATSMVRVIASPGKARQVKAVERLAGSGVWIEQLAGRTFQVSAPAFFQVNTAMAEALVREVQKWVQLSCKRNAVTLVGDLYAGVGTFALSLANLNVSLLALELSKYALKNLRANGKKWLIPSEPAHEKRRSAQSSKKSNQCLLTQPGCLQVIGGDASRAFESWHQATLLVLDPPRSGLSATMPGLLANSDAKELIYCSCDPQTWARDCARLLRQGFKLDRVIPFDLFPQTYHGETLSHFTREGLSGL